MHQDLIFMHNAKNTYGIIPIDGRPHDKINSEDQTFMGDSIGWREGDTLVVDVVASTTSAGSGGGVFPRQPEGEHEPRRGVPAARSLRGGVQSENREV
jgi:hypothetical protein